MNLTFAPKGILQIDDARIIFKNFEGRADQYNFEGNRNFAVLIDDEEIRDALLREGWNVKTKAPRDDGDLPFMFLPVKVKFNGRGPSIYLESGTNRVKLSEDMVACIDTMDIISVDLDIRPYDWEINKSVGRTAYLQSMRVVQEVDRFSRRFAEEESPEE